LQAAPPLKRIEMNIDIEVVKATLKREIRDVYKHENACCELDVEQAEETLKAIEQQQARIEELEKASEWISVEDRLPKPEEKVIVIDCEKYISIALYYSSKYSEIWVDYGEDFHTMAEVTHWKPTKPPEGES
jgi:hypothetical protein